MDHHEWPVNSYDLFPGPIVRWTLLAVVLGALAGLLFRHTVAAMAVTAVSYVLSLALNYLPSARPGFWLWECTEGDGLLVLTAVLATVLLWRVHRRPQCWGLRDNA